MQFLYSARRLESDTGCGLRRHRMSTPVHIARESHQRHSVAANKIKVLEAWGSGQWLAVVSRHLACGLLDSLQTAAMAKAKRLTMYRTSALALTLTAATACGEAPVCSSGSSPCGTLTECILVPKPPKPSRG